MSELLTPRGDYGSASFSRRNRMRRAVWGLAWALLFRPTPRPAHRWRAGILRLFGAKVERGTHVYPRVRIWAPWNLDLREECGVGDDAILYSMDAITIGRRAVVSQGAHLCCGTHDYDDPDFPLRAYPIVVGDRAWICAEAFISPGVQIGEGAVVGARSVVTRDIEPWTVCAGSPCRVVRNRSACEKAGGFEG
ncbi:MAG TPA: DapH/DapD/GlmU-related protein [Fimbriimonas sp.]